jgi:hypothetical protein
MIDTRTNKHVQALRLTQAAALLQLWGIYQASYNYVDVEEDEQNQFITDTSSVKRFKYRNGPRMPGNEFAFSPSRDTLDFRLFDNNNTSISSVSRYVRLLAKCVYALNGGVRRAHLVPTDKGALLKELFTRDGAGSKFVIIIKSLINFLI